MARARVGTGRLMAMAGVMLGTVFALGGAAQALQATATYPTHVAFSTVPTGGGYEGRGQMASVKITSSKAACRQNRPFKLDLESMDGHVEETHLYRTNAAGVWTLEIVALPSAPTRASVKVLPKRLDTANRCLGARTTVPLHEALGTS